MMKKSIFILLLCLLSMSTKAQIKAITEDGDEVFLYYDGTWKFAVEDESQNKEIPLNEKSFSRAANASFLLKSVRFNVGFYFDTKKWSFNKTAAGTAAEYEFQYKEGDLYAMAITERVEVPLATLKEVALANGRAVAPDLHVVKEEYRMVNGLKVLLLQMNGTTQGVKFSYFGYYFSNSNGTLQFVTYTSQSLMDEFIPQCEELLNGLIETQE